MLTTPAVGRDSWALTSCVRVADALLLVDALERHDITDLTELETETSINIYTLLSDSQRTANEFRREVADVLPVPPPSRPASLGTVRGGPTYHAAQSLAQG